jgi:ribosome-interacting GTPase 1
VFKQKKGGGVTISHTVPMTKLDERTIRGVLQNYKLHNMVRPLFGKGRRCSDIPKDVMIREDVDVDQFLDVLLGTRKYTKCIYCYNVRRASCADRG